MSRTVLAFLAAFTLVCEAFAQQLDTTFTVYGPRRFDRSTGAPVTMTESFTIPSTAFPPYTMYVINGDWDGTDRVSSATVTVNGVVIINQDDLNQQVAFLQRPVSLAASNTIDVRLSSQPKSFLIIGIVATDLTPPRLTVTSPPDNFITNGSTVTVTGTVFDETAVTLTVNGTSTSVGSDGSFSRQVTLAEGLNIITVVATDARNNSSAVTRNIRRDSHPPILTVSAPSDGFITNQASITLSGTVIDSTQTTVTANGTSLSVAGDGSFSGQVALVEGVNTITFVATDQAGNSSTVLRTGRLDTQPPAIVLVSPPEGLITSQTSITVSGSVTDSTAVTLTVNGVVAELQPDGSFNTTVQVVEGINVITVAATDAAGNSSSVTRLLRRDTQAPVLILVFPVEGTITNQPSLQVSGTVTDSTSMTVTVNGTSVTLGPQGEFTAQALLIEGLNSITTVVTDAAGNSTTDLRTIRLDTQPPQLIVSEPLNGLITNQDSVLVSGSVSDSTAVSLTLNGQQVSVESGGQFSIYAQLLEGINRLTLVAPDAAGNSSTTDRDVRLDTQAPILTVTSPLDSLITNQASLTVAGTVTDSTSVTETVNGTPAQVDQDGSFSTTVTLAEGIQAITVVATDQAGNSTTLVRTVFIDTMPPVLTLTAPADSLITSQASINVQGTVSDSTAITLRVNGTTVPVGADGSWSTDVPLVEGFNTITVEAVDVVGNMATVVRHVQRSSLPPVLTISSPMDGAILSSDSVLVSGRIASTSTVTLTINGTAKSVNTDGTFSHKMPIIEGQNHFALIATDALGQRDSSQVSVVRDTRLPLVNIISPAWTPYTTDSTIVIMGSVVDSSGLTLSVNGVYQQLDGIGSFQTPMSLAPGVNTFTIQATDLAGNSTTVIRTIERVQKVIDPATVAPLIDRTVTTTVASATEFLYIGTDPIQKNVAPGTINALRVTALRGRVLDQLGNPLSGVTIRVSLHPELGFTLSRDDGMYDLVVNGGSSTTLDYTRSGFLPAQRTLDARWQTYGSVDDVVLLAADTIVHHIDFVAPEGVQGKPVTDEVGTRRPTVFFEQGTQASLVFQTLRYRTIPGCSGVPANVLSLPTDSLVPINGITVRVQEYSVGADGEKALPAPLPSTVAYSFAFELQADEVISRGATSAQLSQPATLLLENVMNFPEGMSVPLGYYDRTKAGWLPCDNGQVIRVLGSDTGYANIDFNGDGFAEHPDSLLIRGISYAEQQYLATVYGASQSLLRVEFTKLGTYAIGYGFVLPAGAKAPSNPLPDRYPKVDRDNIVAGSVIGVQSQMLGESVPIVNTNMSLHYRSDRVEGRREAYTLDIPLTGSPAPDSVLRVEIEVEVAGQVTKQTYTPQANLKFQFEWDGKDVYGRKLQGQQNVLTTISYYYQTRYAIPADWSKSFSTPTGQVMIRYIPARKEMAKTQIWEGKIGAFDILSLGIGGWSLSQHHGYDVLGRILYTGDGQVRSARVMDNVITTIAGISTAGQNQICHPQYATPQPALQIPMGVVGNVRFRADGSLWLSEANKLRKLDTTGIISTIAGLRGNCGSPYPDTTEGIMANCATFGAFDMIEGPDKSIYIAHGAKEHIWRITPDGELKHFAGVFYNTGSNGYLCYADGDGGPALKAHLGRLSEMAFGKDGSLYFADMFNHRIRKISPDGIITTVAGASKNYMDYGYSGDGGPAIKAKMYEIRGFAMGPDGSLFISDYRNHRIRKVTPDGIIATIAGTGVQGSTGDGGRAIYARVAYPYSMTVGNDGTLYFCETGGKVRAISTDGYIKTIVGSGSTQWLNNGPATAAQVGPQDAEFGADRNLYVSDWPFILSPARVTRVGPPLPGMQLSEILVASEDGSEQYVFTLSGRHLRTLDALTGVTKYTFNYDTQNRLVSIVDIDSLVTTIERDTSGKATAIISPYGVRTQLALDANGYLLHATNPANESRQFTYTDKGLMTSMTDARGSTYTYTYDSLGYLTKDMDPIGGFTAISRAYDSTGYTVTATTAMGKVTKYRVDQLRDGSKQFTTTDPNGLKTTTSDGTNGTATSTAPNGMQIPIEQKPDPRFGMQSPLINLTTRSPGGVQANLNQYRKITQMSGTSVTAFADSVMVGGKNHRVSYDGIQKVVTRTSPEGRRTFSYFDSKGKTVKDSVPGITAVTYKYDAKGRKIETKQGARITRFEYDDFGNLQRFIDTYGRTASYNHDAADRLVRKVAPDSTEISFAYDSNGNTVSITPPGRPPHIFDYSLIDLETLYTPPFAGDSARSTASLYNRDREIVKIARSDSLNIEYVYGGNASLIGYPKKILYDRGQLTVLYDTIRATITGLVTQNGDSITYQYDGDLLKKISWSGAVRGNLAYTYSNDRLVITEKANVSDSVNFKYDRDGLLAAAGALKLVYSPLNNLLLSDTLAGLITEYSYDSMGDLSGKRVKYAGDYLAQTEYVRDSLGYIIEERSIFEGIQTKHSYSYDGARRLWRAWKNDTLVSTYGYDQGGNRLSLTTPSNVVTGSYDDQDKLLTYGNVSFVYSESGDLRKRIEGADSTWYDYDALGNLLRVLLPTGDNIEYVIDGGGRRVARKVNGIVTNRWIYRDGLRIVAELDSSSQIIARYVYAGKVNVPEYVLKNGVMYRVVTDHLGSVNLVINTNTGQVVQKIEYDEYGKVLFDSNPGFVPFGFAGGLYDPQTRLVRFGARDYDASVGRWTVKDPARFEGKDVNFYGYVGQNPINETDPQGFWWEPEHRKLTSDAMVANGFKAGSDEIRMAQEANIWVDRPSNQLNNPEHGMPECSLSAITAVQNAYLANAIISSMLADITGDNSLAMSFLGAGLHVVQDQYAHYEQGFHGSWVGHGLGAVGSVIGLWSSPDDPNANKEYLDKAAAASDNYVKRFLQRKF